MKSIAKNGLIFNIGEDHYCSLARFFVPCTSSGSPIRSKSVPYLPSRTRRLWQWGPANRVWKDHSSWSLKKKPAIQASKTTEILNVSEAPKGKKTGNVHFFCPLKQKMKFSKVQHEWVEHDFIEISNKFDFPNLIPLYFFLKRTLTSNKFEDSTRILQTVPRCSLTKKSLVYKK